MTMNDPNTKKSYIEFLREFDQMTEPTDLLEHLRKEEERGLDANIDMLLAARQKMVWLRQPANAVMASKELGRRRFLGISARA